jgi:uncharacterized HhH-GPD family protein
LPRVIRDVGHDSFMTLSLPISPDANELLRRSPLALLVGMVLDQQIPLERAFASPYELVQRLGHEPDAQELADYDPAGLVEIFKRVQEVCRILVDQYGGDAGAVWAEVATGQELVKRIGELPGFGKQKAQIFAALLGKQFEVRPKGWREACGPYGGEGAFRSVADIVDDASLIRVREYKQQAKAAAKAAAS